MLTVQGEMSIPGSDLRWTDVFNLSEDEVIEYTLIVYDRNGIVFTDNGIPATGIVRTSSNALNVTEPSGAGSTETLIFSVPPRGTVDILLTPFTSPVGTDILGHGVIGYTRTGGGNPNADLSFGLVAGEFQLQQRVGTRTEITIQNMLVNGGDPF